MIRERMVWTLVAALLGFLAIGWVKPPSPDPLDNVKSREAGFFLHKTHGVTDVHHIILGDSRALRDLAPEELGADPNGQQFFNFAYESGGMNDEMYDAVEQRLAADGKRSVLLAVTPLAFMPWKVGNAQYREYLNESKDLVLMYRLAPRVAEFLAPIPPSSIVRRLTRRPPQVLIHQVFHEDGWIETDQTPSTSELETERAVVRLRGNRVSPELIDAFMERTRTWSGSGIRVFGLRPPSSPQMHAIEDTTLAFDQGRFVRRFEEAGGIWIQSVEGEFETYDGSHLRAAEARRYSRFVGNAINSVRGLD